MKALALVFVAFAINFASATAKADACEFAFRCQGSICERVVPSACVPQPSNTVVYTAPPTASIDTLSAASITTAPVVVDSAETPRATEIPLKPPSGLGCAENSSCYGDISNINGMPTTNLVNGYFRRDGTYVRGHYRSSGRR